MQTSYESHSRRKSIDKILIEKFLEVRTWVAEKMGKVEQNSVSKHILNNHSVPKDQFCPKMFLLVRCKS